MCYLDEFEYTWFFLLHMVPLPTVDQVVAQACLVCIDWAKKLKIR